MELIEGFRPRPHYRRGELPYKEAVRLLRSGEGIPESILDISDAFDGLETMVFFDYAHVGPMGNRIIAERIVESLVSGKYFKATARDLNASLTP